MCRSALRTLDITALDAGETCNPSTFTKPAARRIRPKLMTGAALLLGLIPILWSTGTGADVMKRIAAPMVGGIASTLLIVLLLFPALYAV